MRSQLTHCTRPDAAPDLLKERHRQRNSATLAHASFYASHRIPAVPFPEKVVQAQARSVHCELTGHRVALEAKLSVARAAPSLEAELPAVASRRFRYLHMPPGRLRAARPPLRSRLAARAAYPPASLPGALIDFKVSIQIAKLFGVTDLCLRTAFSRPSAALVLISSTEYSASERCDRSWSTPARFSSATSRASIISSLSPSRASISASRPFALSSA